MSMSDDVDSAGAEQKRGTGLKNPYASTGAGQNGGQPGAGLPGLAAFGKMQAYTAQTPQMGQPPSQENGEAADRSYEAEQQPEQEFQYTEEPAAGPVYQHDAADAPYAGEDAPYAGEEMNQPGPAQLDRDYAEEGQDHPVELAGLAAAYEAGTGEQPASDPQYDFTADELHQYMAEQADQPEQPAESEEAFDLSPHMALQTFEARYDQHPEVSLASFDEPAEQPFFHENGQTDAEFPGNEEADDQMPPPKERKSRRTLMFAGGLIGALALGGALAFAYKTGGNTQLAEGAAPPLIKADDRPVKVAPEEPGGRQFAHQNKQIYDRLEGDQKPEVEKIVPRQENVVNPPAQSAAPQAVASAQNVPGAPHKVRTLKVMPDGSVVVSSPPEETAQARQNAPAPQNGRQTEQQQLAVPALPAPGSDIAGVAVTMPPTPPAPAAQADHTTVASVPEAPKPAMAAAAAAPEPQAAQPEQRVLSSATTPAPMPQPKPAAPARQTASVAPSHTAASQSSTYVVQVASRRSQAMALAAFADLQQKYTTLLGDYQPMIQSADLGSKGVWYRLRVGPMNKKADADGLCRNLKKAGLRSCLVRPL